MKQISNSSPERRFTPEEVEDLLKSKCAQEQFYSLALFDILGFSNFVEKNGNQVVLDLYQKLLDLIYKYDRGNDPGVAVPNHLTDDWKQGIYIYCKCEWLYKCLPF